MNDIQLPENKAFVGTKGCNYLKDTRRSKFDVWSKGPSSGRLLSIFQVVASIPTNKSFVIIATTYTGTKRSRMNRKTYADIKKSGSSDGTVNFKIYYSGWRIYSSSNNCKFWPLSHKKTNQIQISPFEFTQDLVIRWSTYHTNSRVNKWKFTLDSRAFSK